MFESKKNTTLHSLVCFRTTTLLIPYTAYIILVLEAMSEEKMCLDGDGQPRQIQSYFSLKLPPLLPPLCSVWWSNATTDDTTTLCLACTLHPSLSRTYPQPTRATCDQLQCHEQTFWLLRPCCQPEYVLAALQGLPLPFPGQ